MLVYPTIHARLEEKKKHKTRPAHTFMQLAHGKFLSHLILRCWQSTQARMRVGFEAKEDAGLEIEVAELGLELDAMTGLYRICSA